MDAHQIARVAHEVNRAYCQAIGDDSQPDWLAAPEWQRDSALNGVNFHLANPDAGPDHSHNEWLQEKRATGWKYGPVKNPAAKEHPCFVEYDALPTEQKAKDYLFRAIVHALRPSAPLQLPRYRSHKIVWALKIKSIDYEHPGFAMVTPEEAGYVPFQVSDAFLVKHGPKEGGYYVAYEDGYESFSPADAFEAGYTRI